MQEFVFVTLTEYTPAIELVAFERVGLLNEEVKDNGPDHAKLLPPAAESKILFPSHTVEPVAITLGNSFTVIAILAELVQLLLATLTV